MACPHCADNRAALAMRQAEVAELRQEIAQARRKLGATRDQTLDDAIARYKASATNPGTVQAAQIAGAAVRLRDAEINRLRKQVTDLKIACKRKILTPAVRVMLGLPPDP